MVFMPRQTPYTALLMAGFMTLIAFQMACEHPKSNVQVEGSAPKGKEGEAKKKPTYTVDLPEPPPASGFVIQEKNEDGTLRIAGLVENQKKYLEKALQLLRETPNIEWIQAEACAALASMTSGLCIRKQIDREHPDWLEDVVTAIMGVKSITKTVKEIDPDGKETR